MGLINQHQVALLHVVDALVNRLDSGKQDLGSDLALFETGRIDSSGRIGPDLLELRMVLFDQLTNMRDDQDALIGECLEHTFDKSRHHQRLAPGRWDDHQRIAGLIMEIVVDALDGGTLVGTKGKTHFNTPGCECAYLLNPVSRQR